MDNPLPFCGESHEVLNSFSPYMIDPHKSRMPRGGRIGKNRLATATGAQTVG